MGISNELCSPAACSDTWPQSTFPCLALTVPAAPGTLQEDAPQPQLLTHTQSLVGPQTTRLRLQPQQPLKPFPQGSSGSGKSRGGLLREGTGNPDPGGCLSAGTQVTGDIGGVVGAGVRRRLSHSYSSACLWGLAWRVAGNRTQRHAGHRDCVSYGGSWVPWGWRYLGPAQCRNCGTGEGIRMSCPFSSRRSQSIR